MTATAGIILVESIHINRSLVFLPGTKAIDHAAGMAMTSAGFSPLQAMGMNIIVFAGTAQLGTLPLIAADAPVWLIITTALALNLRFVIFSAAIAPGFRGVSAPGRWLAGHVLTDGVFAVCLDKLLHVEDPAWRLGYYLAPALWAWLLWQIFALTGIYAAGLIPKTWSLEFMATIALITLLVPMAKVRPMLIAALVGGTSATLLRSPSVEMPALCSNCRPRGWGCWFALGLLPAE